MANLRLPQTIREDLLTLQRSLRLVTTAARRQCVPTAVLTLCEAALPAAGIWLLKRVIDTVAAAQRGSAVPGDAGSSALALAGSYVLVIAVQQSVRVVSRFMDDQVNNLVRSQIYLQVMEKASAYPDLSPFESPRFHDRLELFRQEAAYRPMHLKSGLTQAVQSGLALLCMLLFLSHLHPALALIIAITAGPSLFCQRRLQGKAWNMRAEFAPLRRRLVEYERVLLTPPFAKEVRLFGIARHVLGRYRELSGEVITCVHRTRWRLARVSLALTLLASVGVGAGFAYVIHQALRGALTLGDLSLFVGALFQANAAAAALVGALAQIHEALPFMRELFAFLDSSPTMPLSARGDHFTLPTLPSRAGSGSGGAPEYQGFRLEGVTFRYPDAQHPVFDGVELEIPWGKTTALVGENGTGKSTLVKLLTRLYDPAAGRVLLNGIDLREYDLEELRRQIAVVFQEFARYQLPVWENIGLGDVTRLGDRDQIREAARRAGADPVIRRLPLGEDTMLGREFDGGVELSGGEWQKIALARAFMRDAPILILDEPTAALDPRSEHDVYRRFHELAAGRTTLLISHRFSTVQMADRILVLEGGRVIEEGDHRGLVERGGRYAELYALQAERYRQ